MTGKHIVKVVDPQIVRLAKGWKTKAVKTSIDTVNISETLKHKHHELSHQKHKMFGENWKCRAV